MRRRLTMLWLAAALAAPSVTAQTRDAEDLEGLTVLQVDPTRNEIRVQEPGSTRIRTIELDERTRITGGALGGPVDMQTLQPGDTIRVPGALGSVSDRVQADEITVLTAPRVPGTPPSGMGIQPREGFDREPSALQPGGGSALGGERPLDPNAFGTDPQSPSAIEREPGDAGMIGADPGATDQDTRGTGSAPEPRTGLGTRGGAESDVRSGTGAAGSSGSSTGTTGGSGTSGSGSSGSSSGGSGGASGGGP